MNQHFHTDIAFVVTAGISAILVINGIRFLAAWMATKDNALVSSIGAGVGATVHFGN